MDSLSVMNMKNNIIIKLAKNNLKDNKLRSVYLFITILISAFTLFTFVIYLDIVSYNKVITNEKLYGTYDFAVQNITDSQMNDASSNPYIHKSSQMHLYGEFDYGNIGYIDDYSLLPMTLYDGTFPKKDNQIAIEKNTLLEMKYPLELGQIIEMTYTVSNGNVVTEYFELSGILNDYSSYMLTTSLQAISTKRDILVTTNYYYQTKTKDAYLEGKNIVRNDMIFINKSGNVKKAENSIKLGLSLLTAALMMNGLNNISQSKEKELILLRGVGAGKMQIVSIIFIETFLLSIPAVLIGYGLSLSVSLMVCNATHYQYCLSLESSIEVLIICLLTLGIGTLFPAIKASTVSLSGALNTTRKRIKIRHIHLLTPYYLTKRHMRFSRIKNIVLILLVAYSLTSLSGYLVRLWEKDFNDYNDKMTSSFKIEIHDDPENNQWIDRLKANEKFADVLVYDKYNSYDLGIPDCYQRSQQSNAFTKIYATNDITDEELESLGVDKEAFRNGECGLISLPKMIYIQQDLTFGYVISYSEDNLKKHNAQIIQENSINVGDILLKNVAPIKIAAIMTSNHLLEDLYMYDIIVSPAYTVHLEEPITRFISFTVNDKTQYDAVLSNTILFLNNEGINYDIIDYNDDAATKEYMDITYIQLILYTVLIFIVLVLLLYQQFVSRIKKRKREIGIFEAVGMEKSNIIKMLTYEGAITGLYSILVSVFFKVFPEILQIMINPELTWQDFSIYSIFPKTRLWFYMLFYLVIFILFVGIYYLPAKRILTDDIIHNIRYQE